MINKQTLLETGEFTDNEYLDKYINLVNTNSESVFIKCRSNKHHIIPRYVFKEQNKQIDNSSDNLVNLLYSDHILAHYYLSGCAIGRGKYWNLYAIYKCSGQKYFNKDVIENLEKLQDFQKIYDEAVHGTPNHRKGNKVTAETIEKMRNAQKERIQKYGNQNTGRVWINNSIEEIMVSTKELQWYLSKGYTFGRIYRHSDETKKKMVRYGKRSEEFCQKMRNIALNQSAKTEESIKKQAESLHNYYTTHKNPFSGKKHSEETKQLNREKHLGKITVNKNNIIKMITKDELNTYISDGWRRGRK